MECHYVKYDTLQSPFRKSNFQPNATIYVPLFFYLALSQFQFYHTVYLILTLYCADYSLKCVIFWWNYVACSGSRCVSFYGWILLLAHRYLSIDILFFWFEVIAHFSTYFIKCSTFRTTLFHYGLNFFLHQQNSQFTIFSLLLSYLSLLILIKWNFSDICVRLPVNKLTFIPIEFLWIDNNEFLGSTNGTRIVVFFFSSIHRRQNILQTTAAAVKRRVKKRVHTYTHAAIGQILGSIYFSFFSLFICLWAKSVWVCREVGGDYIYGQMLRMCHTYEFKIKVWVALTYQRSKCQEWFLLIFPWKIQENVKKKLCFSLLYEYLFENCILNIQKMLFLMWTVFLVLCIFSPQLWRKLFTINDPFRLLYTPKNKRKSKSAEMSDTTKTSRQLENFIHR